MQVPVTMEELLQMRPRRALPFETTEAGRITVLRPKILGPRWVWLLRFLARPNYRVKLDERGSFVWLLCDGARSLREIAAAAQARFADPDSVQRAATFVLELARGGFLVLDPPLEADHGA